MPISQALYEAQRRYVKKKSAAAADIGDIPPIKNPARRESCRMDLFRFLTTYFPRSTGLSPFSDDHRRVIERIQHSLLNGGNYINAVYRGFAKTTISENAVIWATIYAHRRFVPIFGAGAENAAGNIDSIKLELSDNDLLYEDFPEICHAIRALEGKPQRCASQTHQGKMTHIGWTADKIVFPQIEGSKAGGGVITAHGIGAALRGLKHKGPDGTQQRPDAVLIDDPQTDESAGTPAQVLKRMGIIRKTIMKLGGHMRKIAVVINATVIQPDDLVERFLDPAKHPEWQGERIKMVKRFADEHDTLWEEYRRLRTSYDADQVDDQRRAHKDATDYYRLHREAMDKGCIVSWEHCFDPELEISAIQHAYNCLIDDGPEVFASECQNEPLEPHPDEEMMKPREIANKVNGLARGVIPIECEYLSAFVDVQGDILYYLVMASATNFTAAITDYGTFPEQKVAYFTLATANETLSRRFPTMGLEARIHAGLEVLVKQLATREWKREDGAMMKMGKILIDANWGKSTGTVRNFCRRSEFASLLMPAHGKSFGPDAIPMDQYAKRPGERIGHHWMIPSPRGKVDSGRHVLSDVNYWKSFIFTRLASPIGEKGSLTLYGKQSPKSDLHKLLADHIGKSEYRTPTEGRGRKVDVWKQLAGKPDNHWLDCCVGCFVALSMLGCNVVENVVRRRTPMRKRNRTDVLEW